MRKILIALTLGSLLCVPLVRADDNRTAVKTDRISLFKVPLQCPSAPEIGCGSRAKPFLMELERDSNLTEAWLNATGTVLAVIGAESSTTQSRSEAVKSILEKNEKNKVPATELDGEAREKALKDFQSRTGWYRRAEVDRLSEKEAGIIAERLIRRIRARASLTDEKAKTLQAAFNDYFIGRFTGKYTLPEKDVLLNLGREQHLDDQGIAALKEAIAKGHQPAPNEK